MRSNEDDQPIKKFDPKLKHELLDQNNVKVARARRAATEARTKAETQFRNAQNVIMPKYEHDKILDIDRECEQPPQDLFIGLGWDEDKDTERKHYRRFYPDELENVKSILPKASPFNQYDLRRGQTRGAKVSFWQRITNNYKTDGSGQASDEKVVGRFKAVVEVEGKEEKKAYFERKDILID